MVRRKRALDATTKKRAETDRGCVRSTSCGGTALPRDREGSTNFGPPTCCGWSFGHSRAPGVVPRCARTRLSLGDARKSKPTHVGCYLDEKSWDKIEVSPHRLSESPLLRFTFRFAAREPEALGQGRREIKRFESDGRPAQQSLLRRSACLQLDARQSQIARQRTSVNFGAGAAVVADDVTDIARIQNRSEERRVGKKWNSRRVQIRE